MYRQRKLRILTKLAQGLEPSTTTEQKAVGPANNVGTFKKLQKAKPFNPYSENKSSWGRQVDLNKQLKRGEITKADHKRMFDRTRFRNRNTERKSKLNTMGRMKDTFPDIARGLAGEKGLLNYISNDRVHPPATKKPLVNLNPSRPRLSTGKSFKVSPGASDLSGARRAKTSPAQLSERKGFTPGGTNSQRDKLNALRAGLRSAGNIMGVSMGSRGEL